MQYNILVVDDDREFREEIGECLEDYRIHEAENGDEATEILDGPDEIDLVILDVKLPGRQGTEILRDIKERDPELGVIIITGHSSEEVAAAVLESKADDYIEKPIDIRNLLRSIDRILIKNRGRRQKE